MEGHHPLDPILWASILEDSKISEVLGGLNIWIHEKLQLDPLRLVCFSPINLVHLLHSWPLSGFKFFTRSVITVLYVERTIAIYNLF
jgi:hypothetical protein